MSEPGKSLRILITGSRDWYDDTTIKDALWSAVSYLPEIANASTLISGACPTGADMLAESIWENMCSGKIERHPADWNKLGKRAGFVRNAEMVNSGVDVCLAFILNESKGATMTVDLCAKKGVPTTIYSHTETITKRPTPVQPKGL